MANPNETLKALLISLNICSEETAEQYSKDLSSDESQRLINVLKEGAGGESLNLLEANGGFLSGLRKVIDARVSQNDTDLPINPKGMTESQKNNAIEAHAQILEKSDDEFLDGIKNLLAARNEDRVSKLAAWRGELSDEDFPRKMSKFTDEVGNQNKKILEELQNRLKDERIDTEALLKKHRSE